MPKLTGQLMARGAVALAIGALHLPASLPALEPVAPNNLPPWKNPAEPLEVRVRDLIGRLTLEEKALQLCNRAPAIPRLDLPAYDYWNEALHGVARNGTATVFPQAIGMAATWDSTLLREVGDVIATEARAKNRAYRESHNGD